MGGGGGGNGRDGRVGGGGRSSSAGLLSATQLLANQASGGGWGADEARSGGRRGGGGATGEAPRGGPLTLLEEQTQGATMVKARSRHAPSQLAFRDGYEEWRTGMDLLATVSADPPKAELQFRNGTEHTAARPPTDPLGGSPPAPDPLSQINPALAKALRHGQTSAHSAYALTTAAQVLGRRADVRAGPAQRATDAAAKASLRAAAASEDARRAAAMAGAARAQAGGAPPPPPQLSGAAAASAPSSPEPLVAGERAKVRMMLPS